MPARAGGTVVFVPFEYFFGDIYPNMLLVEFLLGALGGEDMTQVLRCERFFGCGIQ